MCEKQRNSPLKAVSVSLHRGSPFIRVKYAHTYIHITQQAHTHKLMTRTHIFLKKKEREAKKLTLKAISV